MSESSNEATAIRSSPPRHWVVYLTLMVLVAVVYWPVHSFGFVSYDDPGNVTENPHVASGLTAENIRWAFSSYWVGHWAPLTWISFQLEASCWHLNPGAMHIDNVLLHALSVGLLFHLLRRTTNRLWISAWVAAVFAVHPLHVESVAWITERRDVLSAPLLIATLCAYSGYARCDRHARGWYALSLVLYALSLMGKAVGITLPVLMLLFDFWPLQRQARVRCILLEKIPFLIFALGAAWAAQQAQLVVGGSLSLAQQPIAARLSNAVVTYALYLLKFIEACRLAVFYPLRIWSAGQVLIAVAALLLITTGVVLSRRRYAIMGWGWFIICMSPMIGLFHAWSQGMADRYMYLPMIGLLILLAWGATEMRWRRTVTILGWTAVLCLAGAARHQVGFWQGSHQLLEHALELMNDGAELHIQLAQLELREGNREQARAEFETAIKIDPSNAAAEFDLGNLLLDQPDQAIPHLQRAVTLDPHWSKAKNNLAVAYLKAGRKDLAFTLLQQAIADDPTDADAHANIGLLLMQAGRLPEALVEFKAALEIDPGNKPALSGMQLIQHR